MVIGPDLGYWTPYQHRSQAGEDPLDRKRASFLLQRLLRPEELRNPMWTAWFTLHGLLEEFAGHLLKPAWEGFSVLHPAARQYASPGGPPAAGGGGGKDSALQAGKKAKARAKILTSTAVTASSSPLTPSDTSEESSQQVHVAPPVDVVLCSCFALPLYHRLTSCRCLYRRY